MIKEYFTMRLDSIYTFFYTLSMKRKIPHLITLKIKKSASKLKNKNENVLFAKNQFTALMKKNLTIPVSIYNL